MQNPKKPVKPDTRVVQDRDASSMRPDAGSTSDGATSEAGQLAGGAAGGSLSTRAWRAVDSVGVLLWDGGTCGASELFQVASRTHDLQHQWLSERERVKYHPLYFRTFSYVRICRILAFCKYCVHDLFFDPI